MSRMQLRGSVVFALVAVGCSASSTKAGIEPGGVRWCAKARQSFERPTPRQGESGDGLPPTGTATKAAAENLLDSGQLRQTYEVVDTSIVSVDGRAWRRTTAGHVQIVREKLYTVHVTLSGAAACPDAPASYNGVPLTFGYRAG